MYGLVHGRVGSENHWRTEKEKGGLVFIIPTFIWSLSFIAVNTLCLARHKQMHPQEHASIWKQETWPHFHVHRWSLTHLTFPPVSPSAPPSCLFPMSNISVWFHWDRNTVQHLPIPQGGTRCLLLLTFRWDSGGENQTSESLRCCVWHLACNLHYRDGIAEIVSVRSSGQRHLLLRPLQVAKQQVAPRDYVCFMSRHEQRPDGLILLQPLCLHWCIRAQVRLSLRTCSGLLEKPLWLAISRLSWVCGPGGCFQLQSPRARVSCSDRWTDLKAHKPHSILGLHRLPWPLQPPRLLVLSYSLTCHFLISFFFGLNPELCSLVLISHYFPNLSLPLSAISFVSLSLAASLLSSPSPTISHISLYPFLFHPQHFGSRSPRSRAPSSGLPHIWLLPQSSRSN